MEKINILKVENLIKEKKVRTRIANDAKCEVCGQTKEEGKLRRFNEYILCEKHNKQLEKYGKITDPSPIKHKKELEYCWGDIEYCKNVGFPENKCEAIGNGNVSCNDF